MKWFWLSTDLLVVVGLRGVYKCISFAMILWCLSFYDCFIVLLGNMDVDYLSKAIFVVIDSFFCIEGEWEKDLDWRKCNKKLPERDRTSMALIKLSNRFTHPKKYLAMHFIFFFRHLFNSFDSFYLTFYSFYFAKRLNLVMWHMMLVKISIAKYCL